MIPSPTPPKLSLNLNSEPECVTSLLHKCSTLQELKQVHAQLIKTRLIRHTIPSTRFLSALCRVPENLYYAKNVFEKFSGPTTVMWNTIIRASSGSLHESLHVYSQMLINGAPHNAYTFPFLLKACSNVTPSSSSLVVLEEITKQIHCNIVKTGFFADVYAANSLMHVYVKLGSTLSAHMIFDRMTSRDNVSWNLMIDAYAKSGKIQIARQVFDEMEMKNVVSWTSMIGGYVENGCFKEALLLFGAMQELKEIEPDNVALASALSTCTQLGALDEGKWIHNYIIRKKTVVDQVLGCVLVDMYAKCGELEEAFHVFNKLKQRNVHVWTAMITGFAIHGHGKQALSLFADMEKAGIKPNTVTCTAILTACSHAGLVDEGKSIFKRLEKDFNISPIIEHYGCMVDLLGRAGLFSEAECLINAMPMEPNVAVWGALLNACHVHKNFALAKRVGKILINLEPKHGGRYVQLARILAAEGKWNEAAAVREKMKDQGVQKIPGSSSISLDGRVHEFVSGDCSHPQKEKIYREWMKIASRLKSEGYKPVTEDLLLDLDEKEKESAAHHHSEKLAIAFGFIRTEPTRTIHIIKNLRVCKDCHNVMKMISKVYNRKIIMRDRSRFHCFTEGNCSCRDYW